MTSTIKFLKFPPQTIYVGGVNPTQMNNPNQQIEKVKVLFKNALNNSNFNILDDIDGQKVDYYILVLEPGESRYFPTVSLEKVVKQAKYVFCTFYFEKMPTQGDVARFAFPGELINVDNTFTDSNLGCLNFCEAKSKFSVLVHQNTKDFPPDGYDKLITLLASTPPKGKSPSLQALKPSATQGKQKKELNERLNDITKKEAQIKAQIKELQQELEKTQNEKQQVTQLLNSN